MLLLDLRQKEDFEKCRLPTAVSYPAAMLNRDIFLPEMHRCKRDPSKMLVVYHSDEQTTAATATLIVQKGWGNVYAISGGFQEVAESYPEVLDGELPELVERLPRRRSESCERRNRAIDRSVRAF